LYFKILASDERNGFLAEHLKFWGRGSSGTDESMDRITMTGDPKALGMMKLERIGVKEIEMPRGDDEGLTDYIPDHISRQK
jgi:hypothetical protein